MAAKNAKILTQTLKKDSSSFVPKINKLPFLKPKKHLEIEEDYKNLLLNEKLNLLRS